MKNFERLFSLCLITIAIIGCSKMEYVWCNSFIEKYSYFNNLEFNCISVAGKIGVQVEAYVNLTLEKRTYWYTCFYEKESIEGYMDLCRKHGDTSYTRHKIPTLGTLNTVYSYCDFTEISITSDSDYDSFHPAGQSLNDIIHFVAFSPNKFIRSGYKDKFDYRTATELSDYLWSIGHQLNYYGNWMKYPQPYHPIDKPASEITSEDLILLGHKYFDYLFWIIFEKEPDSPGTHNIKVTLHADNGKVYENTVEVNF